MTRTGSPSVPSGELWHFSSLAGPSFPEPGYSHTYSTGHAVPEPQAPGKDEPFLSLLQEDGLPGPSSGICSVGGLQLCPDRWKHRIRLQAASQLSPLYGNYFPQIVDLLVPVLQVKKPGPTEKKSVL